MSDRSEELVEILETEATIDASEEIEETTLLRWLRNAIAKHAPAYTVDNLPTTEEEGVILLARIDVCVYRASKHTDTPDVQVNSLGADRSSVFTRNMTLAAQLRQRYDRLVAANSEGGSSVSQSRLFKESAQDSSVSPTAVPASPVSMVAAKVSSTATSAILSIQMGARSDYRDTLLVYRVGGENYVESNNELRYGVKRLHEDSLLIASSSDPADTQFEITDLTTGEEYYFMFVRVSSRGVSSYSNEVRVVPA